jgi:hypothetical protein
MTDSVIPHPHSDLLEEAKREREVAESPEGQRLREAIVDAVKAYSKFLDRNGLIFEHRGDEELPRLKAEALVVTDHYGLEYTDITLKNGALDRVFGNGVNPCPFGLGPKDIPHKPRKDD